MSEPEGRAPLRAVIRYLARHHVGLLALFVALGGTAYAATLPRNSVGTKQLRPSAVTSAKVKNRSLRAIDFASGQLPVGERGPQGATGPQGPGGATGPQGEPGVVGIYIEAGGPGNDEALCDAGDVAVGGGGIVIDDGGFLTETQPMPFSSGVPAVGWKVHAKKADGTDAGVTAWVVCAF